MKSLAIIASVILIVVPTVSLVMSIVAGREKAHTMRMFVISELIPSLVMWILTLTLYWLAGIFKNFGL